MLKNVQALVLAAGTSKRFNTGKIKLIEKMCGQELIMYPLSMLMHLELPITVVVGHQRDLIQQVVEKYAPHHVSYAIQHEQEGTAHAVQESLPYWNKEHILIMRADMPLVTSQMIEELYAKHIETNATISFISAHSGDPSGFSYSRVEQKDNTIRVIDPYELSRDQLLEHCCINAGIMIVQRTFLEQTIARVPRNKHTQEFHISALINIAAELGKTISMVNAPFDRIRDINSYQDLWAVEQIKRAELIRYWMTHGVRFSAAQNVHIDLDVEIEPGTSIGMGASLLAGTRIGSNCTIGQFAILERTIIGSNCTVHPHTIITDATIHNHAQVGPFAHIQQTTIGSETHIGNFVEVKRSVIGEHTRAKHLTYLGDATVGSHANIGAGTITCNYDGKNKHRTIIKDHAFIGSNNSIVAPVTIHEHALTAAGSTITANVPMYALGIARSRQVNKPDYRKPQEVTEQETPEQSDPAFSFYGALKTNNEPSQKT